MTGGELGALAPGVVALALHGPLWVRSRRHGRRLATLELRTLPLARRAPPHGDRSMPVEYRFRHDLTGQRLNTISEALARDLMADPEWRLL